MPDPAKPDLTLARGQITAEISLRPFNFTVRRAGRRVLRNASAWVADGVVNDHFVQFTEGVMASEDLAPHERAVRASVSEALDPAGARASETLRVGVKFEGGREGEITITLHADDRFTLKLT